MADRPNTTPPNRPPNRPPNDPAPNDVIPASNIPPRPLSDVQPHVAPTPPAPDVTPAPDATGAPDGRFADDLTADALRQSLDHGRGQDKVNFSDPAAAPLGTDDEAGGHPPTREQVRMAAASELAPDELSPGPRRVEREARTIPHLANAGRVGIVPILLVAGVIVLLVVLFL